MIRKVKKFQLSPAFVVKKFRWSRFCKVAQFRIEDKVHLTWNSKRNPRNYESASSQWNSKKYIKLNYTYSNGKWDSRSNKEQVVFCILWDFHNLTPHEEFIGMILFVNNSADHIVLVIKDILLRINLKIENAWGQCYDEASAMAGTKSGVATQLKILNRKCIFKHCYWHALNLAVRDVIRNFLQHARYEICQLLKKLPKRNTRLNQIRNSKENESKGIYILCHTRWLLVTQR